MLSQRNLYRKHIMANKNHKRTKSHAEHEGADVKKKKKLDEFTSVYQSSDYQDIEVLDVNSSSDASLKKNRLLNV